MRHLLATCCAITLIGAAPALAQDVVIPETDMTFEVPVVDVEGWTETDIDIETQDLDDEAVWSSLTNERIGDVEEVVEAADGNMYVEMEIGGFLGIGDKNILVPMDQTAIYSAGDDVRVYVAATEEQLEEYPEYDD